MENGWANGDKPSENSALTKQDAQWNKINSIFWLTRDRSEWYYFQKTTE